MFYNSLGRDRVRMSREFAMVEVESPEQEEPIWASITQEQLDQAVHQLPESQREVFTLYSQGIPHRAIAERLGSRLQTVSKRLFDARKNGSLGLYVG